MLNMLWTHYLRFNWILVCYSSIIWRFPPQLSHTDKKLSTGFKGSHPLLFMHAALILCGCFVWIFVDVLCAFCMDYKNTNNT